MARIPMKRARVLITKPQKDWTDDDKSFMKAYCKVIKESKDDNYGNPAFMGFLLGNLF